MSAKKSVSKKSTAKKTITKKDCFVNNPNFLVIFLAASIIAITFLFYHL